MAACEAFSFVNWAPVLAAGGLRDQAAAAPGYAALRSYLDKGAANRILMDARLAGSIKHGKTGMLDHFFDLYRKRNEESPIAFLDWVRTEYDRQACHDGFMASWWGSALTEGLLKRE